ncbi:MAG: ribosome maturation factor RimM [Cyanobacteria bacterium]|nr:ribosome maturation factor RimM [Cyanobacteriota bacterium]MDW8201903.1 ribosome maturation factor RimM [Cyanobacteriota bacterium SKYGB_h_bin112]
MVDSQQQPTDWLEVGKVVGVQGLKGEVRVYPDSDFPERFLQPGLRWLRYPQQSQPQPIQLQRGRYLAGKGLYVLKFEGVDDRTQAEALRDCVLLVSADDRPQLADGEFHVPDLLGLSVIHQPSGDVIGTVIDVIAAGNDLLVVQPHLASESQPACRDNLLIPFVFEIVPIVDLEHQQIEITPPTGLIPGY